MKRHFFLPAVAFGTAALLLVPARESQGFDLIGNSLNTNLRDFRVFDNFSDSTSDNNTQGASQFPGALGLELALWKAAAEWGSHPQGDGSGDPHQGVLGDAGANFDFFWSGNASGIGNIGDNIISAIGACDGATLAYTELTLSTGWRMRYCDNSYVWDDDPDTNPGGRWDIQGIAVHELGHALGLNHSTVGSATMTASVGINQAIGLRSVSSDDVAGVQAVYGPESASKPVITGTFPDPQAGTLTIRGTGFTVLDNDVWFTNANVTVPGTDPRVRVTGLFSSDGTELVVPIPADAAPGEVLVQRSGNGANSLSNSFPTDLVNDFGSAPPPPLAILSISPEQVPALVPGTDKTVTIQGNALDTVTSVQLGLSPLDPERWEIVDENTLRLDMPQTLSVGIQSIGITDGTRFDFANLEVVAPSTPVFEMGSGDPLNQVDRDNGLTLRLAGPPGSMQLLYASTSSLPSMNAFVDFAMGNNFSMLQFGGTFSIPTRGWTELSIPPGSIGDPGQFGMFWYAQTVELNFPAPLPVSNLQSIHLIR